MADRVDFEIDGLQDFEPVGTGGFATVYVATDSGFGRQVAVKVFHSIDADGRRRFDRERRLMGSLGDHPNVVTPFRSGYTSAGTAYLVMEYLRGGSLQDAIDVRGPMSVEAACDYIIPVAKALQQAHRVGVLHRDIKPANIMLTDDVLPVPKLGDFGIAAISEATATQRAFTLTHSPPETFADVDRRDERSDLYSLASTLYHLIAGRGPFDALDGSRAVEGQMARILTSSVPPTGNPSLDVFLARAMAKNPEDRYPDAEAFTIELEGVRHRPAASPATQVAPAVAPYANAPVDHHQPVSGPVDLTGERTSQRRQAWPLVGVSIALAGLAALGAFLLNGRLNDDGGQLAGSADATETSLAEASSPSDGDEEPVEEVDPPADPDEETPEVVPPGEARTINVAIAGNPLMDDIAEQTPESFTAESGITVEFTIVDHGAQRQIVTDQPGQFDAVMIGMFETGQFGANGWLRDLNAFVEADPGYDIDDVFPTVREGLSSGGSLYASPFYAESSFLMFREDVLSEAGLTMPSEPTWAEVADIAEAIDSDEMAGICLRGRTGWGDLGASFTTVLNTYGGTWWLANDDGSIGRAQVDQPEFAEALNFYVDLLDEAGPDDAANVSFNDCLELYRSGEVGMWYDATVAGVLLEADDSSVRGLNGYRVAPTNRTNASGWLWTWALAIPENSPDPDAAWEFISWATSDTFAGDSPELLPPNSQLLITSPRASTYTNAAYLAVADPFDLATIMALASSPIDDPGTTPRPGLPGVQYVGVPEFQDVGNRCTELFSAAIAGSIDVDTALADCQLIADEFSS